MGRLVHVFRSAARRLQPAAGLPAQGLAGDLQRLFPDGVSNVFDVGAYVGEFAALVHEVFPTARVWCFEPFVESYERIRHQFAGAAWLVAHNVGLSDRSGTAELIVGARPKTNSLVSSVVTNGAFESGRPRVPVQLTTLSECTAKLLGASDPHLSIVKIDTEGHDLQVLRGGEELLRNGAVEALHVEVMFIEHFKGARASSRSRLISNNSAIGCSRCMISNAIRKDSCGSETRCFCRRTDRHSPASRVSKHLRLAT